MAQTVRDFKNMLEQKNRLKQRYPGASPGTTKYEYFVSRSERHSEFWGKLNRLGGRRIHELPPEQVPDVDATVTLSDEEWSQLESELCELL